MRKNSKNRKPLTIAKETVRRLSDRDLTLVTGGCNTTSWSSEVVDHGGGQGSGA